MNRIFVLQNNLEVQILDMDLCLTSDDHIFTVKIGSVHLSSNDSTWSEAFVVIHLYLTIAITIALPPLKEVCGLVVVL